MNATLLERLRSFQILPASPIDKGRYIVARLIGVDFQGILDSPEFGFTQPFDVNFGKIMIRTATHLLGGDACGRYAFTEQLELSLVLDRNTTPTKWSDATELQSFLIALASSKMSLQIEDEALFTCTLYGFSKIELAISYLMWRQQEAYLKALDRYCVYVLSMKNRDQDSVTKLLGRLGPLDKEEILRENYIEYTNLPNWQWRGSAVYLTPGENRVTLDTNLPQDTAYQDYLVLHLG